MNVHEELFARNFIVPEKRERYIALLKTKKGRIKIRFGLDHCKDLDKNYITQVPIKNQNADNIYHILRTKGASENCYVISSNSETDEQEVNLYDAVLKTIGKGCGTFISCIAGKLGYFEFEEPNERYILEKKND